MNTTGASACLSCPVGQVQLQTGQSKCEECLAGSYRGTTDNANEACVPCAAVAMHLLFLPRFQYRNLQ